MIRGQWGFLSRMDIPSFKDPSRLYLRRIIFLRCPWFGIYLHRICMADDRPEMHNHPFPFVSIVLRGSYDEMVPGRSGPGRSQVMHSVRWLNAKRATDAHYILRLSRTPVWSLVLRGPKVDNWGFFDEHGTWFHHSVHPGPPAVRSPLWRRPPPLVAQPPRRLRAV